MDALDAATDLVARILPHCSEERAKGEQRYLKLPHWTFLGVATPPLRDAVKGWAKEHQGLDHDELWAVIDVLWREAGPTFEHRRLVSLLVERWWRLLDLSDAPELEELFATSETWALVDAMANAVGKAATRDPAWQGVFDEWSVHPDFWLRRVSVLALGPGRKTEAGFDWAAFERRAEPMLEDGPLCGHDKESRFFLRKVLGWVMRDMSRVEPERVVEWMALRTHRLSGLTVREGARHLDEAVKNELLAAHKDKRPARL